MELLHKLGIDWRLLIAQIINFLILLAILHKFLYRPLLKLLAERTAKIEKGLTDAQQAEERLKQIIEEKEKSIIQTKTEAQKILAEAEKNAEKQKQEIINQAKIEGEKLLAQTKQQIAQEKEKIIWEIKGEVADLVVVATAKVLEKVIDQKKDRELIEETVKIVTI